MRRNMLWSPLALVAVACTGPGPDLDGGQFGEESGARCDVALRTPLSLDEVSPLGFTAADVIALSGGPRTDTLDYADGASSALAYELAPTGVYEYVEQEVVVDEGNGGAEPAMTPWCPNLVQVQVELRFATDDGRFAEARPNAVSADTAAAATLYDSLEGLAGTFDPWDFAPAGNDYDDARAWLDLRFDAAGGSGVISGQGSGTDGEVAFAEAFDVAAFGPAME